MLTEGYTEHTEEGSDDQMSWREVGNIPPATIFLSTPYDPEAHYAKKRSTSWVGYKVHLTETCDDDAPHLITHVQTSLAPSPVSGHSSNASGA